MLHIYCFDYTKMSLAAYKSKSGKWKKKSEYVIFWYDATKVCDLCH